MLRYFNKIKQSLINKTFLFKLNNKIVSLLNLNSKKNLINEDSIDLTSKIATFLLKSIKVNFFLQVGIGNVDIYKDPFYNYLKTKRGVIVDANKNYLSIAKNYYTKCKFKNLLVSDEESDFKFYQVKKNSYRHYKERIITLQGLGSLQKSHILKHNIYPNDIEYKIIQRTNISKLINKYKFDLLIFDVEGADIKILINLFKTIKYNPNIIFEHSHASYKDLNILLKVLKERKYKQVFFKNDIFCFNCYTKI